MKQFSQMKQWLMTLPREARALLLAGVIVVVLTFLLWLSATVSLLTSSLREVSSVKPQVARLLGYEQVGSEFEIVLDQAELRLRGLSYRADEGAQAGARLQQSLRGFAEEYGLVVTGSQLLPEEQDAEEGDNLFEVLSVDLSLQGMPAALDQFLGEIKQHRPRLAVTSLNLVKPRTARQRQGEPPPNPDLLNIRMTVVGLRELRL